MRLWVLQTDDGPVPVLKSILDQYGVTPEQYMDASDGAVKELRITLVPNFSQANEDKVVESISRMDPATGMMVPRESLRPHFTLEHFAESWEYVTVDGDSEAVLLDRGGKPLKPNAAAYGKLDPAIAPSVFAEMNARIRPNIATNARFFSIMLKIKPELSSISKPEETEPPESSNTKSTPG